jgi:RNA polymerase primary sigma factor
MAKTTAVNKNKRHYDEDENSLSLYLKEINEIPLLTHEDEVMIAKRAQAGDMAARALLARSHLRFVVNVAKKFQNQGMSLSDLISEGNLGLLHAIDRFDPDQGFHFISYAVWWIRQAIMKALGEKARSIRLPQNRANELVQIEKVRKMLSANGREPEAEEIAQLLGFNKEMVQDLLNVSRGTISLDAPARSNSETLSTLGEFIPDEHYATPQQLAEAEELKREINVLLSSLSPKEATILELRFGLNGKEAMSLKEIGEKFNLTKERIRQIEKKALSRLQHPSRKKRLESFVA